MSDLIENDNGLEVAEVSEMSSENGINVTYRKRKKQNSFSNIMVIVLAIVAVVVAAVLVVPSLFSNEDPSDLVKNGIKKTQEDVVAVSNNLAENLAGVIKSEETVNADGTREFLLKVKQLKLESSNEYDEDELKKMGILMRTLSDSASKKNKMEAEIQHDNTAYLNAECYIEGQKLYLHVPQAYDKVLCIDMEKALETLKTGDMSALAGIGALDIEGILESALGTDIKEIVDFATLGAELQKQTKKLLSSIEYVKLERSATKVPGYIDASHIIGLVIREKTYSEYIKECVGIVLGPVEKFAKEQFGESAGTFIKDFVDKNLDGVIESITKVIGGDIKIVVSVNKDGYANYIGAGFTNKDTQYRLDFSVIFAGKKHVADNIKIGIADNKGMSVEATLANERGGNLVSTKAGIKVFKDRIMVINTEYTQLLDKVLRTVNVDARVVDFNGEEKVRFGLDIACNTIGEEGKPTVNEIDIKSMSVASGDDIVELAMKYTFTPEVKKIEKPSGTVYDLEASDGTDFDELREEMEENLKNDPKINELKELLIKDVYLEILEDENSGISEDEYFEIEDEYLWSEDEYLEGEDEYLGDEADYLDDNEDVNE